MKSRRLTLDIHAIELRTLGHITDQEALFLECLNCGHLSGLGHEALIARYGADMPLYDLRTRARCRTCHHRETRLLIKRGGSWWPEPPKGR